MDKRLQLENTDPLKNLYIAKPIRFTGIIHNIGWIHFIVYTGLKSNSLCTKQPIKIRAIDVTGSIGKKLRLPNGKKSSHLFLYECVCASKYGNFPAFQMVSANQDAAIISYFFLEINNK